MTINRKNKNAMKQADKELIKAKVLFKTEEIKDDETILQTGKVWCEDCQTWIDQVDKYDNYLCCSACGNGVVMLT